jgi:hypothetical protein
MLALVSLGSSEDLDVTEVEIIPGTEEAEVPIPGELKDPVVELIDGLLNGEYGEEDDDAEEILVDDTEVSCEIVDDIVGEIFGVITIEELEILGAVTLDKSVVELVGSPLTGE